jgi:hypothetical protein
MCIVEMTLIIPKQPQIPILTLLEPDLDKDEHICENNHDFILSN